MMKVTLAQSYFIRGARQVLTMRGAPGPRRGQALGHLELIEDGSVLVRDGLIAQVGSTRRLENLKEVRSAHEISAQRAIILPAFVDPSIDLAPDPAPHSPRRATVADFAQHTRDALSSCQRHGTLHAQVKVRLEVEHPGRCFSLLRRLTPAGEGLVNLVKTCRVEAGTALDTLLPSDLDEIFTTLSRRDLAQCLEFASDLPKAQRAKLLTAAGSHGFDVNLAWSGGDDRRLLELLLEVQPRSVACPDYLSIAESAALARCPVPVVFSSTSSMFEDTSSTVVRRLADAGAPLALCTGYHPQQMPVMSMQMAITLSVARLKLTIEEALVAATVNAAHAVGLGHRIGTLESGKAAHLLVVSVPDYRELPRHYGANYVSIGIYGKTGFSNRQSSRTSAA